MTLEQICEWITLVLATTTMLVHGFETLLPKLEAVVASTATKADDHALRRLKRLIAVLAAFNAVVPAVRVDAFRKRSGGSGGSGGLALLLALSVALSASACSPSDWGAVHTTIAGGRAAVAAGEAAYAPRAEHLRAVCAGRDDAAYQACTDEVTTVSSVLVEAAASLRVAESLAASIEAGEVAGEPCTVLRPVELVLDELLGRLEAADVEIPALLRAALAGAQGICED